MNIDLKPWTPEAEENGKRYCKIIKEAGFDHVRLPFTVDRDDLSFFDPDRHEWVAEPGKFDIYIAAAADDVRGKVTFELK